MPSLLFNSLFISFIVNTNVLLTEINSIESALPEINSSDGPSDRLRFRNNSEAMKSSEFLRDSVEEGWGQCKVRTYTAVYNTENVGTCS